MAKKKQTKIPPTKSQKVLERQYQKELNQLGKAMIKAVNTELLPYLKSNQESYVTDGIADQLQVILTRLKNMFTGTLTQTFALTTAEQMVNKVSTTNEKKFNRAVSRATGVNLGEVISSEGLEDFVKLSVNKNVSLINSIPEEYLKQIETIVNNGVASGQRYSQIAKQINSKVNPSANKTLANRIKTIARNEVSTINSQINLRRSEQLGIKKGIWRTAEDERVRKCHNARNGKEFDLSKGLFSVCDNKTIWPGEEISCRCNFSPVIEV